MRLLLLELFGELALVMAAFGAVVGAFLDKLRVGQLEEVLWQFVLIRWRWERSVEGVVLDDIVVAFLRDGHFCRILAVRRVFKFDGCVRHRAGLGMQGAGKEMRNGFVNEEQSQTDCLY